MTFSEVSKIEIFAVLFSIPCSLDQILVDWYFPSRQHLVEHSHTILMHGAIWCVSYFVACKLQQMIYTSCPKIQIKRRLHFLFKNAKYYNGSDFLHDRPSNLKLVLPLDCFLFESSVWRQNKCNKIRKLLSTFSVIIYKLNLH